MLISSFRLLPAFLSIIALIALTACGSLGNKIIGTGPLVANERMVLEFDEIESNSSINLVVAQGPERRVTVNAQTDVQPRIKTEVKGGKLTITMNGNVDPASGTNIAITIPSLEGLDLEGSGNVQIIDQNGKKLALNLEGSGNVELRNIRYEDIDIDVDGSGDVSLSGQSENLDLTVTSSGDVLGYDLVAEDVKVFTKGSGDVRVSATENLEIKLEGSGNVYYRGEPKISLEDKGSGEARADN